MKRRSLILLICLAPLIGMAQWTWQNTTPQGNTLRGNFFIDDLTGFAVGEYGTILKTSDGGQSWQEIPRVTGLPLNSVWFVSPSKGFIVGGEIGYITAPIMLMTSDGGQTWNTVQTGALSSLLAIRFTSQNTGFAAGCGGHILKTTDGGATWSTYPGYPTLQNLTSIWFTDENTGYMSGTGGAIIKTVNAGTTWTALITHTEADLNSVQFISPATGYAVGGAYSWPHPVSKMLKTTDGGLTWDSIPCTAPVRLRRIAFFPADPDAGICVGDDGTILRTTNGGGQWATIQSPALTALMSLSITAGGTAMAAGAYGALLRSSDRGVTWSCQSSCTTFNTLNASCFTNASTGFAVGDRGAIVKTMDSGATWSSVPTGTKHNLRAVSFPDLMTGYAAGDSGTILKTTNGGDTWTVLPTGNQDQLNAICFTDPLHGIAAGGYDWYTHPIGTLLKTTDGGATWNVLARGTIPFITAVCHTTPFKGYAICQNYPYQNGTNILMTSDGWSTWTVVPSGMSHRIYAISFAGQDTGYIAGGDNTVGSILKTTDGGNTWTHIYEEVASTFYAASFADAQTGYVAGDFGAIFKTTDGGQTWTFLPRLTLNTIRSLSFTDSGNGIATADGGNILRTTDGGTNAVIDPTAADGIVIWPNPATDRFRVSCSTCGTGKARLRIITLTGIAVLERDFEGNTVTVTVTGSLSRGMYIVGIITDSGVETRKLILH